MRPVFVALFFLFLLVRGSIAEAQTDRIPFRLIAVRTSSPMVVDAARSAGVVGRFSEKFRVGDICLSFHNTDPRTASAMHVQFVYFDATGTRVGGDTMNRTGTFTTGSKIESYDRQTFRVNLEDCVTMHYPTQGVSLVLFYVDHVDFKDGSSWDAAPVAIPDNLPNWNTATPSPAPIVPLDPNAPPPSPVEFDPLILQSYKTCATAAAATTAKTPLFAGLIDAPITDDRNVFVAFQAGNPDGSSLSHIGATSLCHASSNPDHDVMAQELVKHSPMLTASSGVLRVYFPIATPPATCNAPVRLMQANLIPPSAPMHIQDADPAGTYLAFARVTVGSDGKPIDAVLSHDAGRTSFNDAVRRSALASRFWPAFAAGHAVAGTLEFPIVWVVGPPAATPAGGTSDSEKTLGPETKPLPHGC